MSCAALLTLALTASVVVAGPIAKRVPYQAQVINQKSFNALPQVPQPDEQNGTTLFYPPGTTEASLKARPFLVYDEGFYDVIGPNPTLTLINNAGTDPLYHEAPVWFPPTDEIFFAQNAGALAAGTGLNKSAILQKVSMTAAAAAALSNTTVPVSVVNATPMVVNPNGGTNYQGQILFVGDGQGSNSAPGMWLMNPYPPYNTTLLLNNFMGRQFNSLDDISINQRNQDIYFTDPTYGYVQNFRPTPGIPKQVYRFHPSTGAVIVAADGFNEPNGIAFAPDGLHVYVTDTGMNQGFLGTGYNFSFPSTIYRFDVQEDGTFDNRMTFAYVSPGIPDGIHVDTMGNVYTGTSDSVQVFSPSGTFLGKIYTGSTSTNFQWAGQGRMLILAETDLYYVTLASEGAFPGQLY